MPETRSARPEEFGNASLAPFVRLDFGGRSLLYSNPVEVIETSDPARISSCLDQLRGSNAAGFMSYEAGIALEPKLAPIARSSGKSEPPLLWFGVFDRVETAPPLAEPDSAWAGEPVPAITFEQYAAAVEHIRQNIGEGDVYQVNFTFPCSVAVAGNPVALYAQLRLRAEAPWSALVFTGTHWLVSLSPELFFTLEGKRITCRPMKGTAPPLSDPETLRSDRKNRAENLMIVDLVRNDLSRLAAPGSVGVPELFEVEHYPTVLQMTSTVTAGLEGGRGAVDVLKTIFPCGSITGAPKIAAMEQIAQLEDSKLGPRGPYTGSIGRIDANGDAEFNVAIRTLVLADQAKHARYHVGSGIVIDSDPKSEWEECLQKAAFVASERDFQLLETFALGPLPNPLLKLHLDRLEGSARSLGFLFDPSELEASLCRLKAGLQFAVRVRISLERSGKFEFQVTKLAEPPAAPVTVSIARRAIPSDDFRLAHKTSDRRFYDDARNAAGTFELLFTDDNGFLAEGSFTNLFVADGERLLTPPLKRGLLPGVLRQHLIQEGRAIEQDLVAADLKQGFFIGNSLRGLIPAMLLKAGDRAA